MLQPRSPAPWEMLDALLALYLLAAPLAFLVGISLGLLGGGGSILTVPIFVYVLGMEPKSAIASSLIVVGLTSLAGAARHRAQGSLSIRSGSLFGALGLLGASLGSRVAASALVPGDALLAVFALLMIAVSVLILSGSSRPERPAPPDHRRHRLAVGVYGFLTGALTGLLGAGGGFIIVPVLLLVARMPVHLAIGTSLLVIALNCLAGLLGFLGKVPVHWGLALVFAGVSIAGSVTGASLAARTRPQRLRRAFAVFILLAGVAIFIELGVRRFGG
jgi:uncharacterized membrane protein YfcA